MKKNILFINTSSNERIEVGLEINGKRFDLKKKITNKKAQVVLPMIQSLLEKHSLKLQDITAIKVNTGPGSFTGLRVGISVANALSFALGISVNEKSLGEFIEPIY